MPHPEFDADFWINIAVHVLILGTFLTIFFFGYISKLTKAHIQEQLDDIIEKGVAEIKGSNSQFFDLQALQQMSRDVALKYQGELPEIVENNNRIRRNATIFLVLFFFAIVAVTIYLKSKGHHIDVKNIIIINLIVFIGVGIIEYYFFTRIISKYSPIENIDFLKGVIISRIAANAVGGVE